MMFTTQSEIRQCAANTYGWLPGAALLAGWLVVATVSIIHRQIRVSGVIISSVQSGPPGIRLWHTLTAGNRQSVIECYTIEALCYRWIEEVRWVSPCDGNYVWKR